MRQLPKLACATAYLLVGGWLPLRGQVQPVPIPGGDIIPPVGLFNQFFPGVGSIYDGPNAEPHGIINSDGVVAMGYTSGTVQDNSGNTYILSTDIRVYQGTYVGAVPSLGAGGSVSAKAHGTFVEIWIDLYDPSSGSQLHDFNPGITPNGLFWIIQVPDSAVQVSGDALTIHLENVAVVDQLQFPGGTGNVPATLSFDITYTKSGAPRKIAPTSADPLSAFHWAGKMWDATNSGTFSLTYNDNTFSVGGTFSSSGLFGEMGTERNGVFLSGDKIDTDSAPAAAGLVQSVEPPEPAVLPAPLRARIRRPPR